MSYTQEPHFFKPPLRSLPVTLNENGERVNFIFKFLLVSVFLVTGIKGLLDPSGYVNMIANKGFPAPLFLAYGVLLLKVGASLAILTDSNANLAALALMGFTLAATIMFHNFVENPSELNNALKNFGLIAGLYFFIK